jgi:hypothetical protein
MAEAVSPLILEFLSWVAGSQRTYAETMDAWRTHCPRHPVWDDALSEGLIQLERRDTPAQAIVSLTPKGKMLLDRR